MTRPNVNVAVSGPNNPSTGYKTVALKNGIPLGTQMVDPNTKYIVKYPFEIGINSVYHPIEITDGGEMIIGGVTYYWCFLVSPRDNYTIKLTDDTIVFVTRNPDAIIPTRELTLNNGELTHLASTVIGMHRKAFVTDENGIDIPDNCIIEFEGGSFKNGFVGINNAQVLPTYNSLLNDTIDEVYGVPALGTFYFQKNKPTWSTGTKWIDANGYSPALSKGTTEERPVLQHVVETPEGETLVGDLLPEDMGFEYFDTDLGKPIYMADIDSETDAIIWKDATGNPVV